MNEAFMIYVDVKLTLNMACRLTRTTWFWTRRHGDFAAMIFVAKSHSASLYVKVLMIITCL